MSMCQFHRDYYSELIKQLVQVQRQLTVDAAYKSSKLTKTVTWLTHTWTTPLMHVIFDFCLQFNVRVLIKFLIERKKTSSNNQKT